MSVHLRTWLELARPAWLAALAYRSPDGLFREMQARGRAPAHHGFVDRGGTQAHVVAWERRVVITFRGTQLRDPRDIAADLRIRLVADTVLSEVRVHRGFRDALDHVWPEILRLLADLRGLVGGRDLLLVGHSLGGALATLAAARLCAVEIPAPPRLVSFGAPRVGDAALVARLAPVDWCRVVCGADIVARVPSWWLGYRHGGDLRYIDRHGLVLRAPSSMTMLADRLAAAGWRPSHLARQALRDHAISGYMDRLGR